MIPLALAALGLPLLASVLIVAVVRRHRDLSSAVAIGAMLGSMLLAYGVFFAALRGAPAERAEVEWLRLAPLDASAALQVPGDGFLPVGIQVDPLTALMLVVVTTVSFLVQLYSRGYMVEHGHRDPGYNRFFAYLSLFTFSMLGLVLANNLLTLYIFWELVGLSSYLLIGFWYHKPEAWIAAKKAFITTRVGDVGLFIGILVLWGAAGTVRFDDLFRLAEQGTGPLFAASFLGQPVLFWGVLGLFAGAVGKSGQFPLHVWLPDAMEGPTPVSALIHAATMVAAGVYLVARTFPLFEAVPQALTVVAFIGGFTAIFAATMGLVSHDMKRVMAYSTVSQLGYMMLALGAGSVAAAMFHLFTHAYFKALLFLSAGSVIHATETNDMREMGGLRKAMPVTFWTMLVGALSLAGVFPLAGFWSKDEILAEALGGANAGLGPLGLVLFGFALVTVPLTAFYDFRMLFMSFLGRYRGTGQPRESPAIMAVPLLVLAVPAALAGLWGSPFMGYGFQRFLEGAAFHAPEPSLGLAVVGVGLALVGIGLAYAMYGARAIDPAAVAARSGGLHRLLLRRYYVDELYAWLISTMAIGLGRGLGRADRQVLGALVDGLAGGTSRLGSSLRRLQTGRTPQYGLAMVAGLVAIAFGLLLARVFAAPA